MHKWSDTAIMAESVYELPPEIFSNRHGIQCLGSNFLAAPFAANRLAVVHVLSVANHDPIERWDIPPLPFVIDGFDAYPPDNVLAVAGERGK